MAKLVTDDMTTGHGSLSTINANFAAVEAAMEKTLSRDGTSPNQMESNLDMNSNRIFNLPAAGTSSEPATLAQLLAAGSLTSFDTSVAVFTQSGSGAVQRTLAAKLAETVSVTDFGAVPDNSTDCTAAIAAAAASSKVLYFPKGFYKVTSLPDFETGCFWFGDGYDEASGSVIVLDCIGPAITQSSAAARVTLANLCVKGETWGASFLKLDAAMLFGRWENVNFLNLHYAVDTNSQNTFWSTFDGLRVRDSMYGFKGTTNTLDMSYRGCTFHNSSVAVFEIAYTGLSGGSFAVNDTLTGGSSSEATTIKGVVPSSATAGVLIVTHAEGTNGSPLTLGYTAAETLSNGSGVTATYASTQGARAVKFGDTASATNESEGLTFIGCSLVNTGIEVKNSRVNIRGGYWESYNADIPVLKATTSVMDVSGAAVTGSFVDIDDETYRKSTGWLPSTDSRGLGSKPLVLGNGLNKFPDPSILGDFAVRPWGGTITKSQSSGVLSLAGADGTDAAGAVFSLDTNAAAISVLIDIESVTNTTRVQIVNGTSSANVDIPQGTRQVVRISTTASGGTPALRLKGVSAAWGASVRLLNIVEADVYISAPEYTHGDVNRFMGASVSVPNNTATTIVNAAGGAYPAFKAAGTYEVHVRTATSSIVGYALVAIQTSAASTPGIATIITSTGSGVAFSNASGALQLTQTLGSTQTVEVTAKKVN